MICSGSQTNIYYVCDPDKEIESVERLIGILQEDQSGRLTIDVNGLRVEDTEPDFEEPRISLVQRNGEWLYAEQLLNRKRLAIVGGGHCSVALCQVMAKLGYEVFIVDRRKDVFTLERATDAREIHIVSDYIEAGGLIPGASILGIDGGIDYDDRFSLRRSRVAGNRKASNSLFRSDGKQSKDREYL